jgi:phosphoribosylcarboxyaminoimidazole (NCAIR) mutase
VLEPSGAALLAAKILSLGDPELRERVAAAQRAAGEQIISDDKQIREG